MSRLPIPLRSFALPLALFASQAAFAGSGHIPITTGDEGARTDFIAARAAAERGDGAEANALARAAVQKDPDFAYGWLMVANNAFSTEEFSDALARAAAAADAASPAEQMLIKIAQRFLDNDFADQLAIAESLVEAHPDSPRAWVALANAQNNQNRFAEGRESFRKAIDASPRFAPAHVGLANSYLFNEPKDFSRAEKHFKAAIALEPGEDNYYWGLGDVYRAMADLERARDYYSRATTLDPTNGTAFVKKGHVNSLLGNFDEARSDYEQGVRVSSPANKAFLANYKYFTFVHEDRPDAAVEELKGLYKNMADMDAPADQRAGAELFTLTNAATICLHEDMYDDAEELLSMRAKIMREDAAKVGTEEFKNLQEANIAYYDGLLAARRGNFDEATKMASRNAELLADVDNPRRMENFHDLMGLIDLKRGDYDSAVEHFEKANLNLMYTRYHLAQALDGAGEKERAREMFREVADWNFNSVGYALVRRDAMKRGS